MEIHGPVAVLGEIFNEEPEQGGFADAGLADHEGKGAVPGEILESGQGLGDAVVVEYPLYGRGFLKGMAAHFEMIEEHGVTPFFAEFV
jgi:hypothetical protein